VVYAQVNDATVPVDDVIVPISVDALQIDNQNKYPGMASSYSEGYAPSVHDGKVTVYLPLIASHSITGNVISVTPDFGESSSSPFIFTNMQKQVKLTTHTLSGGSRSTAYLVDFDVTLKKVHENGQYPITLNISYSTIAGRRSQTFIVYVLIDDVPESASGSVLRIDNQNKYSGMERSYEEGYMPIVKNGKVTVYLPLITTENIDNNEILVVPDFGEPSTSPFIFDNYQKTVKLAKHNLPGGKQADTYLLVFSASLKANRVNGQYPLLFDVRYSTAAGKQSQIFTVYISIDDMVGGALRIDNQNIYDGMENSFSNGYIPSANNGNVTICLPLIATQSIINNEIFVTLNYGETSVSPFVFANSQKSFKLAKHNCSDGNQIEAYLLVFYAPLMANRINGQYPITFDVSYYTADGSRSQQFTVYVSVTDGKDPDATPTPAEPSLSKPKIMLTGYTIYPNPAIAGQPVELSVTLNNTSTIQAMQNIKISLKSQGDIIPYGNNGTHFIEGIGKQESVTLVFHLKERPDVKPEPQEISLIIEYEDSKATVLSAEETLIIEVSQPMKMEFGIPNLPSSLNAGDMIPVTMGVFNLGKGTVYNVMCKLEAPGLIPDGSVFLGNMGNGISKLCEFSVFVGTLDMTVSDDVETPAKVPDDEKYGKTTGKIIVTYEDEFGTSQTEEIEVVSSINRPIIQETKPIVEQKPETVSQWWISVIIAACIIAGLTTLFLLSRARTRAEVMRNADY
jgi:hypothetical protein